MLGGGENISQYCDISMGVKNGALCPEKISSVISLEDTHTHTNTHPSRTVGHTYTPVLCVCELLSYWVKVSSMTSISSTLLTLSYFCLESSFPGIFMPPSTPPSGPAHIRASLNFFPDTSFRDPGSSVSDLSMLCSLRSSCQHLTSHSRSLCMSVFLPMTA